MTIAPHLFNSNIHSPCGLSDSQDVHLIQIRQTGSKECTPELMPLDATTHYAAKSSKKMCSICDGPVESMPMRLTDREFINTNEFAKVINRKPSTIRRSICLKGEYLGIRPIKLGNKLLWQTSSIIALLKGSQK